MLGYLKRIKLSRLNIPDGIEFDGSQKQNIVLSKLALLVILIASVHLIDDGIFASESNNFYLILTEFLLVVIGIVTYILNEGRKHGIAKHFFLLSINILLFFMNTIVPKESGTFFFFFPLMAATFIFYGYSETFKRYFYLILTSSLFIVLTLLDFNIFGLMVEMDTAYDFITNLLSSNILMVMTIHFLIKLNKQTENNLLDHQLGMKKLVDELKDKNIHLEKANTELDKFAYCVSHDLRAPLSSILGLINLSSLEKSAKVHQSYLDMMKDMVTKLDHFIHDIISYSRNTKLELEIEEINLEKLVNENINSLKFMKGWNQIDFILDINFKHPFVSDQSRISIILNNLVANSVKYHDFSKDKPYVRVLGYSKKGADFISIEDNGSGIDSEYHDKIYQMFFRGNVNSTGSGLGLYIVKEIVDKLQGEIIMESTPGVGSVFTIKLNTHVNP
ncbi:MAG: HAMP domain-containing histidine kinase [Cyclobacteriaceae bacterium]|nr:HAMP domain-containing histidine kinase [Cyclobacteriaceae bacterium]